MRNETAANSSPEPHDGGRRPRSSAPLTSVVLAWCCVGTLAAQSPSIAPLPLVPAQGGGAVPAVRAIPAVPATPSNAAGPVGTVGAANQDARPARGAKKVADVPLDDESRAQMSTVLDAIAATVGAGRGDDPADPVRGVGVHDVALDALYRAAVGRSGDANPLLRELDVVESDKSNDDPRRYAARRAMAWVLRREGRTSDAASRLEGALALYKTEDALLQRAYALDALDRTQPATEAYEKLLATTRDPALSATIRLRLALLDASRADIAAKKASSSRATTAGSVPAVALTAASTATVVSVGARASGGSTDAEPSSSASVTTKAAEPDSALFTFASAADVDRETKNRAAVVSALVGKPREAMRLYASDGEGTDRFRQEVRLAEWALLAEAPVEAQEHAWRARAAAALARDRRYALVVLVEAHRADSSLGRLIERFAAEPNLDDESRSTWIDLLRETQRVDEAMELFRRSAKAGFTPQMRRELLEMCREANRDEELETTYGQLIAEEPDSVEWRAGLSRHLLERGRRDEARAVWTSYVESGSDVKRWMSAAQATRDLGLEDLARASAERCLADPVGTMEARLFLFDLEARRGRADAALAQLDLFDRDAAPDAPQRIQLAEAFERIGDKARAVRVLEGVRRVRGEESAEEDLEMRLAWLLSETGEDERALTMWRNLWRRVDSLSRRRQVEDRLMATASRLGVLADIAVELEEKLARGGADDRDAALLVRLYGKVGDPMSAAEVLEEHMKNAGRDEIAVLEEKARIYLGGKAYYDFEKVVRRLIDLDPEKKSDHLRQLAMSQLERGKPTEARDVLRRLAECENPTDAAEFEAGVLALAGLHDDAARTYRRGLAQHPERIDGFLLLGNALNGLRQTERAIGMFQFLAETAERDDLFTVAIDGILNMRAKEPVLRWARRITLERIAKRHDKMYLYQLYSDVSEELNDTPATLRALETSLAIAGEQRSSVLRQLMDASQGKADNSYVVINGVLQPRRSGGQDARRLAYGRRLIGLGDLVPPQVYLDLGESFLRAGEVSSASKTFSMARDVPDYPAFRRQVAQSFEDAGFAQDALDVYERAMASESLDVALLVKAASIHEQLGRDERARVLYASAIEVLLAQHALTGSTGKAEKDEDPFSWIPKNTNEYDRWFPSVVDGFLATSSAADRDALFDAQRALLDVDLAELERTPPREGESRTLASCPRAHHRASFLRLLALDSSHLDAAAALDVDVLRHFAQDETALTEAIEARTARGWKRQALELLDRVAMDSALTVAARARLGVGVGGDDALASARVALPEVVGQLVPLLIDGDGKQLSLLLRRMNMGEAKKDDLPYVQLLVSAATYLRDDTSVAMLAGYALRVLATHAEDWDDTQRAVSLLERVRRVVSPAAFDVIVDGFVANVAQDDQRLERFQYAISDLQEQLGRPLLTAEAVRKRLEESLPDAEYMMPEMVALVPPEARSELVQAVWNKLPATSRSQLALELLTGGGVAQPAELAELYTNLFEAGLDGVAETRVLTWSARTVLDSEFVAKETKLRVFGRLTAKWPEDVSFGLLHAALLRRFGDPAAADEALRKILTSLPKDSNDYFVRSATTEVVEAWGSAHADALLAILEKHESEHGASDMLDDMTSNVLDRLGDAEKRRAVLDRALARSPEKPEVLRRVYQDANREGDVPRAIEMLERLVRFDAKNPSWRRQLVQRWVGLENHVRALEVQRAGAEPVETKKGADEARRLPAADVTAVKKAVDEGRLADARSLYRRTWRTFGESSRFGRFYSFGWSGGAPLWPEDAAKEAQERVESRGGLDGLAATVLEVEKDEKLEANPEKKQRTVYEAVADLEFGADELERQVRALEPSQIQNSAPLLRGFGRAQARLLGEDEAYRRWSERLKNGTASLVDRSLLLDHLERHLEPATEPDRAALSEIAAAVHPLDTTQLRALARIHAQSGGTDRALRIYEWCATLATSQRWYYGDDSSLSASDLIREVRRQLAGGDVERALDAILASSDPGPDESERDTWEALVLQTWLEHSGPVEAARRCAEIVTRAGDPSQGLRRETAQRATWILSRAGDTNGALKALEASLCKFEESVVRFDPKYRGDKSWLLRERNLGLNDVVKLLPADMGDVDAAAWYAAVVERVVAWRAAERIADGTAHSISSLAFLRLFERGDLTGARACLTALESMPKRPRTLDLTLADAHRRLGDTARADEIEEALLTDRRLPVARVHEVVSRWRARSGDAEAYERARPLAEWTQHDKLLSLLEEMATALGREDERAAWNRKRADERTARETFEATKP